jgi:Mitochondrial carrier protein
MAKSKAAGASASPPAVPKPLQFAFGGMSGMAATCVVQPIDLIKTQVPRRNRWRNVALKR